VAWQQLGHAGRVEKRLHLWREGGGEVDLPEIGARDIRFLEDGTLVGWGQVLAGAHLDAEPGEWGVFSLGPDGKMDWFAGTPDAGVGALAASSGCIALARVQEGEGLVVDAWNLSGGARFSGSPVSGKTTDARGGRVEAVCSADGERIIAAWAPRGGTTYLLAGLDGETGRVVWKRDPNQDIVEAGMSPAKMIFSGDDSRIGLFSFRVTHPPAFGVCVYDRDGTLIWRRRKVNCAGISQDLMLSESGDQVLIVGCGRAYVYQLYPAGSP